MIEMEDRVREAFAHTVRPVTPQPDPLARLLRRRSHRLRRRLALAGAAILAPVALVAAGGGLVPAGPPPSPEPADGAPITSAFARRHLESPPRGGLAGDGRFVADLAAAFDRHATRRRQAVAATLDTVTVLFAADVDGSRIAVVAYHNRDRAQVAVVRGPRGASPADLAELQHETRVRPLVPYLEVVSLSSGAPVIGLAPPGCVLATGRPVGLTVDRYVDSPQGDHVIWPGHPADDWVRVTCDGQVRLRTPAGVTHVRGADRPGVDGARGSPDPAMLDEAGRIWGEQTSWARVTGGAPRVLWGGSVPGVTRPLLVMAAPAGDRTAVMLIHGRGAHGHPAIGFPGVQVGEAGARSWIDRPGGDHHLSSTAGANSPGLVAVRIPEEVGGSAVWSDRVLIVAPPGTVSVQPESDGGAAEYAGITVNADGVGVWVMNRPVEQLTLSALDAAGRTLATLRFEESPRIGGLFGMPVGADW